jgi:hypothetical protein
MHEFSEKRSSRKDLSDPRKRSVRFPYGPTAKSTLGGASFSGTPAQAEGANLNCWNLPFGGWNYEDALIVPAKHEKIHNVFEI